MRHVGGGLAEDEGLALGGKQQAQQQLDGRGLARAVGAEQAEDLALADLQVEGLEGGLLLPAPEVAIDLGQLRVSTTKSYAILGPYDVNDRTVLFFATIGLDNRSGSYVREAL